MKKLSSAVTTKVIILAAGEGQRLRPLTNDRPKCLVEYRGVPLIDRTITVLTKEGLNDIVIVGGYKAEQLVSRASRFYTNPDYSSTNMVHSLFCAENELTGDIIISYGDITYKEEVIKELLSSKEAISVVVDLEWEALWRQRMENPLDDAETLKMSNVDTIIELGKKPGSLADVQGQYIGLIKFSSEAIGKIRTFYHSLDRTKQYDGKSFPQMYMTTFLQLIIDSLMPIHAVKIQGGWIEIDSVADLQCQMV